MLHVGEDYPVGWAWYNEVNQAEITMHFYKAAFVHENDPNLAREVAAGNISVGTAEATIREAGEDERIKSEKRLRELALLVAGLRKHLQ